MKMNTGVTWLEGIIADGGRVEDGPWTSVWEVKRGAHAGHTVQLRTAKFNCGDYYWLAECSCGARWEEATGGCWQWGHYRIEGHGDRALNRVLDRIYTAWYALGCPRD